MCVTDCDDMTAIVNVAFNPNTINQSIKKKEYSYDRCPNPLCFNILLLIIYFTAIETIICHTEIEVNRVYFLRFFTKFLT